MTTLGFALYGSCARNDHHEHSDIDILVITDGGKIRKITEGDFGLTLYPKKYMIDLARKGDLFSLHIVQEAKVIFDRANIFDELKNAFKRKSSYNKERVYSSDLGWFLTSNKFDATDFALVNKRIAWCVRTILIANSLEAGKAVFSAHELAAFSNSPSVYEIIKNKDNSARNVHIIALFRDFLKKFGTPEPTELHNKNIRTQQRYFERTGNSVGKYTVAQLLGSEGGTDYI